MDKNLNPFRIDPEHVLQERMKSARKVTREEVFTLRCNEQNRSIKAPTKK